LKPPQMRVRGVDGAIVARIAEPAPMRAAAVREPIEAPRPSELPNPDDPEASKDRG